MQTHINFNEIIVSTITIGKPIDTFRAFVFNKSNNDILIVVHTTSVHFDVKQ